jgi:hypothetical protein
MDQVGEECQICLQPIAEPAILSHCKHPFCFPCIHVWSKTSASCPCCRANVVYLYDVTNMQTHDVLLPKPPKRFPVGEPPPRIARTRPPVRPRTWRPNNPDPRTDYGEMQEDDEEFLLGSDASKDHSVIDLDSSSSSGPFEDSSSEPDSDMVEALAESLRIRNGIMVTRSHTTLTPQQVSKTRTLRSHAASAPTPSPAPPRVTRIPKKSKK